MKLVVCNLVLLLVAFSASQKVKRGFVDHGSNATSYQQVHVPGREKRPQLHQSTPQSSKAVHKPSSQTETSNPHSANNSSHQPNTDKSKKLNTAQIVKKTNYEGQAVEHRENAKVSDSYNSGYAVFEAHNNNFHGIQDLEVSKGEEPEFTDTYKLSHGFNPAFLRLEGGFKPLEDHTSLYRVPEYSKPDHHQGEQKFSFQGFEEYQPSVQHKDANKINFQNNGNNQEEYKTNFQTLDSYKNGYFTEGYKGTPQLVLVYKDNSQNVEDLKTNPHNLEGYSGTVQYADSYQPNPKASEQQKAHIQYSQSYQGNTKDLGGFSPELSYSKGFKTSPQIYVAYNENVQKAEHKDEPETLTGSKSSFVFPEIFKSNPKILETVQYTEGYKKNPQTQKGYNNNDKIVVDYKGIQQELYGNKHHYQALDEQNSYLKSSEEPKTNLQGHEGYNIFRGQSGRSINFEGNTEKELDEPRSYFQGQTTDLKGHNYDSNKLQQYYNDLQGLEGYKISYQSPKHIEVNIQELNGKAADFYGSQGYITSSHDLQGQEGHKGGLQGVVGYKINVQGPDGHNGRGTGVDEQKTGLERYKGNFKGLEGHQINFKGQGENNNLKGVGESQSEWKALDGRQSKSKIHDDFKVNKVFGQQQKYGESLGVNYDEGIILGSEGHQSNWKGLDDQNNFQENKEYKGKIQSLKPYNGNIHLIEGYKVALEPSEGFSPSPQDHKYVLQSLVDHNGNILQLSGHNGNFQSVSDHKTTQQSQSGAFQSSEGNNQNFQHNIFLKKLQQNVQSKSSEHHKESSQPKQGFVINVKDPLGHTSKSQNLDSHKISAQGTEGQKGSFRALQGLQGHSTSLGNSKVGGVKAHSSAILYHI